MGGGYSRGVVPTPDVASLLRFLESNRATGTLTLASGEIDLADGRAVAAWHGASVGRAALDALKTSHDGMFSFTERAARPANIELEEPRGVRASLSMLAGRTIPRFDQVTRELLLRRSVFGTTTPTVLDEPPAATNVFRQVELAALANALIGEYAGGTYGGVVWNDDVAARLAAAGPMIPSPLRIERGRIDIGAVRERTDVDDLVPFLRALLRAIHGEAARTTGDGAARRGYRAAVSKLWGAHERVLGAALRIVEERPPAVARVVATKTLGTSFRVGDREYVLGRASAADVSLPHPSVSRRHARIAPIAGAHVLTDLGSTSGTTVNGTKLAGEHVLRDGDVIGLGEVELRYECV